jgi:hypothetical protein
MQAKGRHACMHCPCLDLMHGLNTLIKHQTLDRFSQLSFKASKSIFWNVWSIKLINKKYNIDR